MRRNHSESWMRRKGSHAAKRSNFARFSGKITPRGKRGIFKNNLTRIVFQSNRISRTRFILSGGGLWQSGFCLLSFSGLGFAFALDLKFLESIRMDLSLGHALDLHPSDPSTSHSISFLWKIPKWSNEYFSLKKNIHFSFETHFRNWCSKATLIFIAPKILK